jgi:four helix bundle protein
VNCEYLASAGLNILLKKKFLTVKPYVMFLQLNHQKLRVYAVSRQFVLECYKLTKSLPADERFGMASQIRRAAMSVHLNLAEGASRKSESERKRYFEIARGSVIEIDAPIDIAYDLEYLVGYDARNLGKAMISCFKLLTGLIQSTSKN